MQHFFVSPEQVREEKIYVEGSDVNHMKNVLRMKTGEELTIGDGDGWLYLCVVESYEEDMAVLKILEKKKEEQRVCRTVLVCGSCQLELEGLLDTGNGLTDPVSRSPVSLVDRAYMELLLKGDRTERIPRMIPYQTISQKGILTAYRIDIMKIRNLSETVEIQKPWIAVMPQSAGRYPLILHRDLLSS